MCNNSCSWIIIILLLLCCCGGGCGNGFMNSGNDCGCNGGCNDGCGCGPRAYAEVDVAPSVQGTGADLGSNSWPAASRVERAG